jgi:ankyrin repeat protein
MASLHTQMADCLLDEETIMRQLDDENIKKAASKQNAYGHYLIYYACKHTPYHKKLVLKLLIANPDAIMVEWKNHTTNPLHIVCRQNRPELISMILEKNPLIVNYFDEERQTPLHISCKYRCNENVASLLNCGMLDLNTTDKSNCTALHYADCNATIMLLQQNKIDLNISNLEGKTPFISFVDYVHFMVKQGRSDCNKELNIILFYIKTFPNVLSWKHPFTDINLVHYLIELNDTKILKSVLPYIDDIMNEGNFEGMTPLHYFFNRKKNKNILLDMLLGKSGIQVNLKCNKGFTALHYACCKFHIYGVTKLLYLCRKEINIYLRDDNGNNALHAMLRKLKRSKPKTIALNASTACQFIELFISDDKSLLKAKNYMNLTLLEMIDSLIEALHHVGLINTHGYTDLIDLKTSLEAMNHRDRWLIYSYLIVDDQPARLLKKRKMV